MAHNSKQDPLASDGTQDLAPDMPVGDTPTGAAPVGDVTLGFQTTDAPPSGATEALAPGTPTGVPTSEFQVNDAPDHGGTCDFPPSANFGTLDFQVQTEALPGSAPASGGTVDATCAFAPGAGPGPSATAQRSVGSETQPAVPDATADTTGAGRAGRYIFKKFHAKGGMGEVWLAEDSSIGRPVALKRILKGSENYGAQFIKEARVTGQLEHPGVIPVHDVSYDEKGKPYYVMKFVHGQTLKEVINSYHKSKADGEPSEKAWLVLLNIFLDLCQTIAYSHSRGVIHRDIKPDNVMIGAYGETLVLDWGLAKVVGEPESSNPLDAIQLSDDDTIASLAGSIKGTPTYFAPEVAKGKVEEVDQLSDVYLLGGVLYNMITGRQPREGKKVSELLKLARTTPPIPPRQLDPAVPKPLDAICRKALAHEKVDRYPSAVALADDVQSYLAGAPVSAYQENFVERTWRWVKKHRTALGRAAAALLLVGVIAGAAVIIADAERGRAKAQAQADQLKREEDARQEIKNFRNSVEEARFYAASANPVAEAIPGLDVGQADVKAEEAIKIAEQWGPGLENMPLEAERPALKKDLYDLLLELAQLKSAQDAKRTQALLERAASFQAPTRGYYRLRALSLKANGDEARANADQARTKDPATPAGAMDYYLLGERSRVESLVPAKDNVTEGKQAGIKSLLARREALLEAIRFYRQALREDPNHYWAHFQLGACYLGVGSYAEAAEAFGACIALRPKAAWGFSSRGLALSFLDGRREDAQADLDHALKLDPRLRPVRLHRARFYVTQKRYPEAEAALAELLPPADSAPMPEAFFARGQMYMERGMFPEAIADFEQAAASPRPIRAVFLHLTRCYLVEQEEQKALESLAKFLKADMADATPAQLHERRAYELRLLATEFPAEATNRREAAYLLAATELEKAVKEGGDTASLHVELGMLQEKLAEVQPPLAKRRLEEAIAAYTRGIDLDPDNARTHILRGWIYANLNATKKARADFARAVEIAPTNAESHTGLGYTEALLKAAGPARVQANIALLHGGQDYLVLHNVACIFGELIQSDSPRAREYEDMAIAQLERAVDLWKLGGMKGPNETKLIEFESAFPESLRARPQFKKLLPKNAPEKS